MCAAYIMTHAEQKWTPADPVWLDRLRVVPVIAVVRSADPALSFQLVAVMVQAGIRFVEIALSSPEDLNLISDLRELYPQLQIGAGTVLTPAQAAQAIQAGAQFVVSPFLDPQILQVSHHHRTPAIPGALTPYEIWQAQQAGATAIKVFPIESVGGARYLHHLSKPLGSLPLIPTGGVTLANSQALLQAGAVAVGIGGDLFPSEHVRRQDWQGMQERLSHFLADLGCQIDSQISHISGLE